MEPASVSDDSADTGSSEPTSRDTKRTGEMKNVDHTHPTTGETFAETGVYDRGQSKSVDNNTE